MRITTLSENTAGNRPKGLLAEYGLSILLETNERKILFDTGQKLSTVHNAALLGIDLRDLDGIVLSHGHFDHTGGLRSVLEETGKIEISFERIDKSLYVEVDGELKNDELLDDQALVIKTDKGLFVIGVSHCTEPKASARLADKFGNRFFYNNAGSVIELK
jgi:metal-dependent hydrolase (beta-lactamase superfamily II)